MRIRIVCQEGFSPRCTGGGSYLNQLYRFLPFYDYIKLSDPATDGIISQLLTPFIYASAQKQLFQSLREGPAVDLIHNNNVLSMPHMAHTPIVTTVHHVQYKMIQGFYGVLPNLKYYPLEKMMLKNSDYFIAVSEFTRDRLLRLYHINPDRIFVIPNGINTDMFHVHNKGEKPFIVFPNALRFPRRKGTYFILPILQKLLEQEPDLHCVMTGLTSPEGAAILNTLSDKFHYLGFIDEQNLSRLYQSAYCVLFPSLYEGFGLVPLEVIASGGIAVSTDVGAVRSYLRDGENGFILPIEAGQWKDRLQTLVSDEMLRTDIRRNNRSKEIRSCKESADDHRRCFEAILNGAS